MKMDPLGRWLRTWHERDVLMPCGGKTPLAKHAGGRWNWDLFDAHVSANPGHTAYGLLLRALCAVDVDDRQLADELEAAHPEMATCPMVETRRGRHYYFTRPAWADDEGFFDGAKQRGEAVDFKSVCSTGTSGFLVVPPSPGKRWAEGRAPWEVQCQEISRSLLEKVAVPRSAPRVVRADPDGDPDIDALLGLLSVERWDDRNSWMQIAAALKNEGGSYGEFVRHSARSGKFDVGEAIRLWDSLSLPGYAGDRVGRGSLHAWARHDDPAGYVAFRAARLPPHHRDLVRDGDRGLGLLAADLARPVMKRVAGNVFYHFDERAKAWLKCVDARDLWIPLSTLVEGQLVALEAMLVAARTVAATEQRDALEAEREHVRKAILRARSHSGMRHLTDITAPMLQEDGFENRLDSVRHLLGVRNGVVDLRTGELRERTPEDMVHTVLDASYDPGANDGLLKTTILEAMADDKEMAQYLQKLLGYGITGDVSEEVFVVFTGSGRNAKGVITQLLGKLMGGFYREMNPGVIVDRNVSNLDSERGKLLGARIAVFNELRSGEKLKTNEVQLLSGGDAIAARPLYRDPMTIDPRHLCLLCTNHMPELSEVLPAITERLLCVHFPVTFTDLAEGEEPTLTRRQADRTLKARLLADLPGVLKWLVDGAVRWYSTKDLRRSAPFKVRDFSRAYLEEQDALAGFLRDSCEVNVGSSVPSIALLDAFNSQQDEARQWGPKQLAAAMRAKGFEKKLVRQPAGPCQSYVGVRLTEAKKN
jgi:P4 family phage/plasmid primase-like protien